MEIEKLIKHLEEQKAEGVTHVYIEEDDTEESAPVKHLSKFGQYPRAILLRSAKYGERSLAAWGIPTVYLSLEELHEGVEPERSRGGQLVPAHSLIL